MAPDVNLPNPVATEVCHDLPRLLQLFEGLGENCDFGVVQRAIGIEPVGLFRFGACTAADLNVLLRTRFERLGDAQDLWLEVVGAQREYWLKSHHCSYSSHTDRFADTDSAEVVHAAQVERTRYLKSKLMRDLSHSRRLFVFKGSCDMASIRDIVAQMQIYGPNCLLWIRVADADHAPGSVQRLADGLLQGFVSRYGTYDGPPSLPVEEWVELCANAYRLWRNAEPPTAALNNLIALTIAAGSCQWLTDLSATTQVLDEPAPSAGVVFEHRLQRAQPVSVCRARLPIEAGGEFVFSAWVRIPENFRGRVIAAQLLGCPSSAWWTADLKSCARWQRVWVAATVPAEARIVACEIYADGAIGSVFQTASWCLERGGRPLGYAITPNSLKGQRAGTTFVSMKIDPTACAPP
jgi:hypothetical protein